MSSADFNRRRPGPGRPRNIPEKAEARPAREEILDKAAHLFVTRGFAATSTRHIADAVGIRQASLYYHFNGKGDILGELLEMTVRPAMDILDGLEHDHGDDVALYTLAFHDASALASLPHNIGVLPRHPDIAPTPECQEYEAARNELREAYAGLGVSCATDVVVSTIDKRQLGGLILQTVESVIGARDEEDVVSEKEIYGVAASCLRLCGVPQAQIEAAESITRTRVL